MEEPVKNHMAAVILPEADRGHESKYNYYF